jgi:hypothetical protein
MTRKYTPRKRKGIAEVIQEAKTVAEANDDLELYNQAFEAGKVSEKAYDEHIEERRERAFPSRASVVKAFANADLTIREKFWDYQMYIAEQRDKGEEIHRFGSATLTLSNTGRNSDFTHYNVTEFGKMDREFQDKIYADDIAKKGIMQEYIERMNILEREGGFLFPANYGERKKEPQQETLTEQKRGCVVERLQLKELDRYSDLEGAPKIFTCGGDSKFPLVCGREYFASIAPAVIYRKLAYLESNGEIKNIKRNPTFPCPEYATGLLNFSFSYYSNKRQCNVFVLWAYPPILEKAKEILSKNFTYFVIEFYEKTAEEGRKYGRYEEITKQDWDVTWSKQILERERKR